ncbi:hypothetical protein D1BOALGB6SA_1368, partial [Olavius sp. associated proteobacterium Delta 1]
VMPEIVAFSGLMLDAGYSMLDISQDTIGEFQRHPVSRNQNPGSVNTFN